MESQWRVDAKQASAFGNKTESFFYVETKSTRLHVTADWTALVGLFLFIYSYNSNHFILEPLNLVDDLNNAEMEELDFE